MKKTAFILLTLALLLCLFPTFASADASGQCGTNLTWSFKESTGKLTITGSGAMEDYTTGNAPWYSVRSKITSIALPSGLTHIGNGAFYQCSAVTELTIPTSINLTSIGNYAFAGCYGLTSFSIPSGVTAIGNYAFSNCTGLTSITISSGVTSIGSGAFQNCSKITRLTIPSSVTSIGSYAFYDCTKLASITIPSSVTTIKNWTFRNCTGLTSLVISDGVTTIEDSAFYNCSGLTSVTIPASVTSLGSAFGGCTKLSSIIVAQGNTKYISVDGVVFDAEATKLIIYPCGKQNTSYTIPTGIISIVDSAFLDSKALTSISIPVGVTSIGNNAFSGCTGLASIDLPSGVTSIGTYAFKYCTGLTSVTVPASVTQIGEGAFYGCTGLTSISDNLTRISAYMYYGCTGLTSVTIPSGVANIGSYAFSNCTGLTSVVIPYGVTKVLNSAFYGCTGLTSVTIGNSVTTLGERAFYSCTGLTSITIPASVTSISPGTFSCCSALEAFQVEEGNTKYSSIDGVLFDRAGTTLIQYPAGKSQDSYVIPNGVTSIGIIAFSNDNANSSTTNTVKLTKVTIPGSITSIGTNAFTGCKLLTTIIFEGDAPAANDGICFGSVTATAYYPSGNLTWTDAVRLGYGGNITWVAVVKETVTVTLNTYPVVWYTDDGDRYYKKTFTITKGMSLNQDAAARETFDALGLPSPSGHVIVGWYNGNDRSQHYTTAEFPDVVFTENDLVYKPVWDAWEHTVTFRNTNGYFNNDPDCTEITVTVPIDKRINEVEKYPPFPNFTANAFDFWQVSDSGVGDEDHSLLNASLMGRYLDMDIVVTPSWKSGTAYDYFVIKLDPNGGAFDDASLGSDYRKEYVRGNFNGSVTYPAVTREGYELMGWSTDPQCTGASGLYQNDRQGLASNQLNILYAIWCDHANAIVDPAVAATCTETGLTEGSHCARCGKILVTQEEVAALGHDLVHHDGQAATCTEAGWEEYDTCSRCNYATYAALAALGHVPGDPVHENEVQATQTSPGSYDEVTYCTRCGAELERVHKTIPQLPMTFEGIVTYRNERVVYLQNGTQGMLALLDGTNTAANMNDVQVGKLVTVTGDYMSLDQSGYHIPEIMDAMIDEVADTQETVAPVQAAIADLDDDLMARLVQVEATKAELAAAQLRLPLGGYEDEHILTVTGVLSADTNGRILLGAEILLKHAPAEPVRENEIEPTCEGTGSYDEVVYCSVCGEELSRVTRTVDALGHAPGEPVTENEVPATVDAEGGYDEVVYCTRCHAELSREHRIIEKLPFPPPLILTQPKSVTVKSGTKATFKVKAKGEGSLSYHWYGRASEEAAWAPVEGETHATFTIVGRLANKDWQYRCGVRNEAGETYSDAVTLFVTLQPPVIKTQPKSVAVKSGVKVTGPDLRYQWYSRPRETGDWTVVEGANTASYTFVAWLAASGSQYYCHVWNDDDAVDSGIATLAVTPVNIEIKTQPKDATVKSGAKAKFSVKAAGPGLQYQWYSRSSETEPWTEVEGAVKADCTITAAMVRNGSQYYCRVWNEDEARESSPATMTVTPVPASIKTQPKDVTVKSGVKAKFSVKAAGPCLQYQWYERASADDPWVQVEGAVKADCTITASMARNGYQYYCKVWNEDETLESAAAILTVTPVPPKFGTQPKSATVKAGTEVQFMVKASGGTVTYQWYRRTSENGEWILIEGAADAVYALVASEANNGWQFFCRATNEDGFTDSNIATLNLK